MQPPALGDDARVWASRAPDVPDHWFACASYLHGVRHTQRVHIHAQRLVRGLRWSVTDARLVLAAALWHDIGRGDDEWDPEHGALSAARAVDLDLLSSLDEAEARLVLFAVRYHCRSDARGALRATDEPDPESALRILRLLKDADGLDRVRLGRQCLDPKQLRHPEAPAMIPFAWALLGAFDIVSGKA
jgi:HD superfamily phosphodiesterase